MSSVTWGSQGNQGSNRHVCFTCIYSACKSRWIWCIFFFSLKCLYCERTFKDRHVLKEHMRKKQHKKVNPKNKAYDRFYVINYLVSVWIRGRWFKTFYLTDISPSLSCLPVYLPHYFIILFGKFLVLLMILCKLPIICHFVQGFNWLNRLLLWLVIAIIYY